MNEALTVMLTMAFTMQNNMKSNMDEWKERILNDWEKSKKMPRKMKKRVRRELNVDWSIANWDPFDGFGF